MYSVLNKKLLYMPPFVLLNNSGFHILVVVLCGWMHIIYKWQITKIHGELLITISVCLLVENIFETHGHLLSCRLFLKTYNTFFSCCCISWKLDKYVKTCADGIVINVVVGGEVITLKNIEESSSLIMAEMPINVSFLHVPCSPINEFEIRSG